MSCAKKALITSFLVALASGAIANAAPRLSAAGASFPSKIYTRWFSILGKSGGPRVNYQSVGSGFGRKAFIAETVDFGASDDPINPIDIQKVTRGVVQIPMIGGTIAFGYNHDCDLKLSQKQAVQIAIGIIKDWNELGCKSEKLTWVHRSDGSGTTKAFTSSMQAFSESWTLGTGKSVNWPSGIGAKGNAGVAGVIRNTPGSIGYVNQSYIKGEIKAASLENLSGEFLQPTTLAGAIALNGIELDENLAGNNPNPIQKGAYPITTLTWILAYESGNGIKSKAIRSTLEALLSNEYQELAPSLGFIPLRGEILEKSRSAVKSIGR